MSRRATLATMCGGLILFLSLGQRHSFGLYLPVMTVELGWSREVFAFGIALQNLVWGVAQPFTGLLADRYGAQRVLAAGAVLYAAGVALMAVSTGGLSFALAAGVLVGLGLAGTAFGIVYGAVSRAVPESQRGHALGIAGALGGLGMFALLPVNQWLIAGFGWSVALLAAACACSLMLLLSLGCREPVAAPPTSAGAGAGDALRGAFTHRGFWLLTAGFLTCGFQLGFITTHLPAYLLDRGLGVQVGVLALGLIALANIFGTYAFGYLGGRYPKHRLLSLLYIVRGIALALFVLLPITAESSYVFALAMGLTWLGTVPLTNGLVGQIFGLRYVSTLFGVVFLSHQIGGFAGVWLGGYLFDRSGSYSIVWTIAIALSFVAAALNYPIRDRPIAMAAAARA